MFNTHPIIIEYHYCLSEKKICLYTQHNEDERYSFHVTLEDLFNLKCAGKVIKVAHLNTHPKLSGDVLVYRKVA